MQLRELVLCLSILHGHWAATSRIWIHHGHSDSKPTPCMVFLELKVRKCIMLRHQSCELTWVQEEHSHIAQCCWWANKQGSHHGAVLHCIDFWVQNSGLALPLFPHRCYRRTSAALLKTEHCVNTKEILQMEKRKPETVHLWSENILTIILLTVGTHFYSYHRSQQIKSIWDYRVLVCKVALVNSVNG